MDESHPVDIRISFEFTPSVALIEIKWLGKSRNVKGDAVSTNYGPWRAREGAQQLADYLEYYHQSSPSRSPRGYLIVIDGRRRGLSDDSKSIARVDGMYYDHQEITYAPSFSSDAK